MVLIFSKFITFAPQNYFKLYKKLGKRNTVKVLFTAGSYADLHFWLNPRVRNSAESSYLKYIRTDNW